MTCKGIIDMNGKDKAEEALEQIEKIAKPLKGMDYYEFLEELAGRLRSYMDCFREEHPEDFE